MDETLETVTARLTALQEMGIDVAALYTQLSCARDLAEMGEEASAEGLCNDLLALATDLADGSLSEEAVGERAVEAGRRWYQQEQLTAQVREAVQGALADHLPPPPALDAEALAAALKPSIQGAVGDALAAQQTDAAQAAPQAAASAAEFGKIHDRLDRALTDSQHLVHDLATTLVPQFSDAVGQAVQSALHDVSERMASRDEARETGQQQAAADGFGLIQQRLDAIAEQNADALATLAGSLVPALRSAVSESFTELAQAQAQPPQGADPALHQRMDAMLAQLQAERAAREQAQGELVGLLSAIQGAVVEERPIPAAELASLTRRISAALGEQALATQPLAEAAPEPESGEQPQELHPQTVRTVFQGTVGAMPSGPVEPETAHTAVEHLGHAVPASAETSDDAEPADWAESDASQVPDEPQTVATRALGTKEPETAFTAAHQQSAGQDDEPVTAFTAAHQAESVAPDEPVTAFTAAHHEEQSQVDEPMTAFTAAHQQAEPVTAATMAHHPSEPETVVTIAHRDPTRDAIDQAVEQLEEAIEALEQASSVSLPAVDPSQPPADLTDESLDQDPLPNLADDVAEEPDDAEEVLSSAEPEVDLEDAAEDSAAPMDTVEDAGASDPEPEVEDTVEAVIDAMDEAAFAEHLSAEASADADGSAGETDEDMEALLAEISGSTTAPENTEDAVGDSIVDSEVDPIAAAFAQAEAEGSENNESPAAEAEDSAVSEAATPDLLDQGDQELSAESTVAMCEEDLNALLAAADAGASKSDASVSDEDVDAVLAAMMDSVPDDNTQGAADEEPAAETEEAPAMSDNDEVAAETVDSEPVVEAPAEPRAQRRAMGPDTLAQKINELASPVDDDAITSLDKQAVSPPLDPFEDDEVPTDPSGHSPIVGSDDGLGEDPLLAAAGTSGDGLAEDIARLMAEIEGSGGDGDDGEVGSDLVAASGGSDRHDPSEPVGPMTNARVANDLAPVDEIPADDSPPDAVVDSAAFAAPAPASEQAVPSPGVPVAMAASVVDREVVRNEVIRLLPELLEDEAVRQKLFAVLAMEAVTQPSALGELTGLRAFLRQELDRVAEDRDMV